MYSLGPPEAREYASSVSLADSRWTRHTENRKDWMVLNGLPTNLQTQYLHVIDGTDSGREPLQIKSADKIKAWVRKTKKGIELRIMRRKPEIERDEYTEFTVNAVNGTDNVAVHDPWKSTTFLSLPADVYELHEGSVSVEGQGLAELYSPPPPVYTSVLPRQAPTILPLTGVSELDAVERATFPIAIPSPRSLSVAHNTREESEIDRTISPLPSVTVTAPDLWPQGSAGRPTTIRSSSISSFSTAGLSTNSAYPSSLSPWRQESHSIRGQHSETSHGSEENRIRVDVDVGENIELPSSSRYLEDIPQDQADNITAEMKNVLERLKGSAPDEGGANSTTDSVHLKEQPAEREGERHVISDATVQSENEQPLASSSPSASSPTSSVTMREGESADADANVTQSTPTNKDGEPEAERAVFDTGSPSEEVPDIPQDDNSTQVFEAFIEHAWSQVRKEQPPLKGGSEEQPPRAELVGCTVSQAVRYETETDAEPPSPSDRKAYRAPARHKVASRRGQKRRMNVSKTKFSEKPQTSYESEDTYDSNSPKLKRHTSTRKIFGPQDPVGEIEKALLRTQEKLLGGQAELVLRAKLASMQYRPQEHPGCSEDLLKALTETENRAFREMGPHHPDVAAYSANLRLLKTLTGIVTVKPDSPQDSPSNGSPTRESVSVDTNALEADSTTSTTGFENPHHENKPRPLRHRANLNVSPNNVEETATAGASRISAVSPSTHEFQPSYDDTVFGSLIAGDPMGVDTIFDTEKSPHEPRNDVVVFISLMIESISRLAVDALYWMRQSWGPEPDVDRGKVRVRWTCHSCGEKLYDDYVERRAGAARELEAYLNRPRQLSGRHRPPPVLSSSYPGSNQPSPSTPSSYGHSAFSSIGRIPSSNTSWASNSFSHQSNSGNHRRYSSLASVPEHRPDIFSHPQGPYLLTCANEDRLTPKVVALNVPDTTITSDRDLALKLREHYAHVNRQWWKRLLKLRSLTGIEFIQFEIHQNRFADIRVCPDVPPLNNQDYTFERAEMLPPVGSNYLAHLFKHPEDYHDEEMTYRRTPKRKAQLRFGSGWGIHLREGFSVNRVFVFTTIAFFFVALLFAIAWTASKKDIQGAFGVAQWISGMSAIFFLWLQAKMG